MATLYAWAAGPQITPRHAAESNTGARLSNSIYPSKLAATPAQRSTNGAETMHLALLGFACLAQCLEVEKADDVTLHERVSSQSHVPTMYLCLAIRHTAISTRQTQ